MFRLCLHHMDPHRICPVQVLQVFGLSEPYNNLSPTTCLQKKCAWTFHVDIELTERFTFLKFHAGYPCFPILHTDTTICTIKKQLDIKGQSSFLLLHLFFSYNKPCLTKDTQPDFVNDWKKDQLHSTENNDFFYYYYLDNFLN